MDQTKEKRYKKIACFRNNTGVNNIWKVYDTKTDTYLVIKKTQHTLANKKKINGEYAILDKIKNIKNVSKFIDLIYSKNSIKLFLEYVQGIDLFEYIKSLDDNVHISQQIIKKILFQVCTALSYVHELGIIHRDIKPENIIFDRETEKITIIDWDLAIQFDPEKIYEPSGSLSYVSPEVARMNTFSCELTPIIGPFNDIWGVGVLAYCLMTNCVPFDGSNMKEILENIHNFNVDYSMPGIDKEGESLLKSILCPYTNRLTAKDILDHPFLYERSE